MATRRKFDRKHIKKKQEEIRNRNESIYLELQKNTWEHVFVLPPWSDEGQIWKEVEKHGMHVCPKKLGVRECVICKEMKKQSKKGNVDFVKEMRLRPVAFLNVIRTKDVESENPEERIKILRLSARLFEQLVDYLEDEDVDITELEAAIPVAIKKKQTGGWRTIRYQDLRFGKTEDISEYITDEVLDEGLHDLDTIRGALPSSDKEMRKTIKELLGGGSGYDDDDDDDLDDDFDDDDDSGFPSTKDVQRGSKKSDDLDDDDDDDLDDEPLKTPLNMRRRR